MVTPSDGRQYLLVQIAFLHHLFRVKHGVWQKEKTKG